VLASSSKDEKDLYVPRKQVEILEMFKDYDGRKNERMNRWSTLCP
jgi:hypothetical protein